VCVCEPQSPCGTMRGASHVCSAALASPCGLRGRGNIGRP
jgi:hypothetical protein